MRKSAVFAVLSMLAALFQAPAADDLLQRVRAKIIQSQPFKADFVQQVYIDEEKNMEESGIIIFADRGRMKWHYLKPTVKIFILESGRYRFYDQENNQLMTGRIGAQNERLIWELLFSDRPGQSSSWDARQRTILLRLDGDDQRGAQELKIRIGADYLPERVEQTAESDVTTVYLFKNYRSRVALNAGEFDLDLPDDVETIEE
jgi:outer membrane lipoprotein-sorting protein